MIRIPSGPFTMGTGEGEADAAPPHRRDLPEYWIDAREVTVAEYARFVEETGHSSPTGWTDGRPPEGTERLPITNVTWFDAMEYAAWAGKRLPTEAEWEKAARGTDGRRFPWGPADSEEHRNLGSGHLEPVGSHPSGASPYGLLDASGNAWEWTADGYEAYPGSAARSVQFGGKYKTIRGGAGEYYYGLENTGTTTQRARMLPYGAHDFVGFRCARSARPEDAPYDPGKLLKEARQRLQASLREPVRLPYDDACDDLKLHRRIPLRVVGREGQRGIVRVGIPFPRGTLPDVDELWIQRGGEGGPELQSRVLARWDDGSVRWVLAGFPAVAGETYFARYGFGAQSTPWVEVPELWTIERSEGSASIRGATPWIETSPDVLLRVRWTGGLVRWRPSGWVQDETTTLQDREILLSVVVATADGDTRLVPLPEKDVTVEDTGPLWATLRLRGTLGKDGAPSDLKYDLRARVERFSSSVSLLLTLTHLAPRGRTLSIRDVTLALTDPRPQPRVVVGTDRGVLPPFGASEPIELRQPDDLHFEVLQGGRVAAEGSRAPGWIAAGEGPELLGLAVRSFWQNHPKALFFEDGKLGAHLWNGPEPFEWEGGLAKTHEIIVGRETGLDAGEVATLAAAPLRASLPPEWACGSGALGARVLPRDATAIERFPYWELVRWAAQQKWVRGMPMGLRHYGDAYMGGPYKGKNAYSNLEYDVPFNFLLEYLRTGASWYLDSAEAMVRHQTDIDTDHSTGQPWKHSPDHTTTEAELGHVFVRGIVLYHLVTGDRRSLEVARTIGDWIAGELEQNRGVGNERQIGWSLYALTGLYDVVREPRYLAAAEGLCNRLLEGQGSRGKFAIRWDNRIAFFNGIAMNGMLTVLEHTGDERLAEGILKVAHRTFGMYPEYALRTLNAFCWAAERTHDPRFLDSIERTWELSMQFLLPRDPSTEEVHAWRFRDFAARRDLVPLFEKPPEDLPRAESWRAIRFQAPEVELFVRPSVDEAPLLVIREGLTDGRVQVFNPCGAVERTVLLVGHDRILEPATLRLSEAGDTYRVSLRGDASTVWQIHHDARSDLVVHDRTGAVLPSLYPAAYGLLQEGASEVKVRLAAMGEGFHRALLRDPEERPAAVVRHFVDFEDPGRYELELKAPVPKDSVPEDSRPWSLEVYHAEVLSIEGMHPYWSTTPEQLFHPERGAPTAPRQSLR